MATRHEIVSSYRMLHKRALQAIKYAKPDRFVVRDHLRTAFRNGSTAEYDMRKIARTDEFLRLAAKWRGLEHNVVRNICRHWLGIRRVQQIRPNAFRPSGAFICKLQTQAQDDFAQTLDNLNKSMGLCIK